MEIINRGLLNIFLCHTKKTRKRTKKSRRRLRRIMFSCHLCALSWIPRVSRIAPGYLSRWALAFHAGPGFESKQWKRFFKKITRWRSSWSDTRSYIITTLMTPPWSDSSETTTAISKAVGCDQCPWWLHLKNHLFIIVHGRKSRLSAADELRRVSRDPKMS